MLVKRRTRNGEEMSTTTEIAKYLPLVPVGVPVLQDTELD